MKMTQQIAGSQIPAGMYFDGMTALPADPVVTMAYVPFQLNKTMYDEEQALNAGTLFKDLNKPFLRGACK